MKSASFWRRGALGLLLLVAGWLAVFGDKTPPGQATATAGAAAGVSKHGAVEPRRTTAFRSAERARVSAPVASRELPALVPRDVLVPAVPHRPGVDLFASASWAMPPMPPPQAPLVEASPTAPALPFTVLGKKLEAGQWEVYLAKGDQTLIVRQGDVIDGVYRVEKVEPPTLNLVYLPLGQSQNMEMGDFE